MFVILLRGIQHGDNWVKDMVLPSIDDMVQSVNLLLKRMLIEAGILRSEFEAERKATNKKVLRLQQDLGQCHYDMQIQMDEIQKRDQKYEFLLEDFKKLGLENARLKKRPKSKASNPKKN